VIVNGFQRRSKFVGEVFGSDEFHGLYTDRKTRRVLKKSWNSIPVIKGPVETILSPVWSF